jgi:hypothetical protein
MHAPHKPNSTPEPHVVPLALPTSARPFTLGRLRGHLTELRTTCPVCGQGIYSLEKQIAKHGADFGIVDWMLSLTCAVRLATPEKCAVGLVDMERVVRRLR